MIPDPHEKLNPFVSHFYGQGKDPVAPQFLGNVDLIPLIVVLLQSLSGLASDVSSRGAMF